MTSLHATIAQTLAPLLHAAKAAMDAFEAQVGSLGPLPTANACRNDLPRGLGASNGVAYATTSPSGFGASEGVVAAPPDLLDFLESVSVGEACQALGLSRRTAHRVRHGYWPTDPRKIMSAWVAYKGRSVRRATSWFVRRVSPDGLRHGGKLYQASQLAGRTGELLAVARAADGELLAQALELPVERFTLAVKG